MKMRIFIRGADEFLRWKKREASARNSRVSISIFTKGFHLNLGRSADELFIERFAMFPDGSVHFLVLAPVLKSIRVAATAYENGISRLPKQHGSIILYMFRGRGRRFLTMQFLMTIFCPPVCVPAQYYNISHNDVPEIHKTVFPQWIRANHFKCSVFLVYRPAETPQNGLAFEAQRFTDCVAYSQHALPLICYGGAPDLQLVCGCKEAEQLP